MNYTIKDLQKDFPNDDACLAYIFQAKYPDAKQYYRVTGRKCWAHSMTGHQIHPLKGTIFEKSSTPLTLWFHAIFLFASAKNGVSAKELQRQLGVTYKCAWRIAHQIRKLMEQDGDPLSGTIEADETYIGGVRRVNVKMENKTPVVGAVKRNGGIRAKALHDRSTASVIPFLKANIKKGSLLITDDAQIYKSPFGYKQQTINHSKRSYVVGKVHTNTIEGFWSQMKRSFHGTYHSVSRQHLQTYVNEFAFRYNARLSLTPVFQLLLARAAR